MPAAIVHHQPLGVQDHKAFREGYSQSLLREERIHREVG